MDTNGMTNPWAGLSSYQDPERSGSQLQFCGRDNESFDVARLIDNNIFVTLYGRSGTGKTSLLNAGVFPRLRSEQYLPVSVRLGMDAREMSFQQGILSAIACALEGKGTVRTLDVVPLPGDEQAPEYLWSYFARSRFETPRGEVLFPVVVLDQFEEVFRGRRTDAEALLRQIYFLMDESHALSDRDVAGEPYSYDFNFRFVVSIREDDLYLLEDSIDNNYLSEMKRARYRLRNLSEEGAKDVILTPGAGLFAPRDRDWIADTLISLARNPEDRTVSAVILSLLCSRTYDDFRKSGAAYIDLPQVEKFVRGNLFERFFNEATDGLSRRERNYIVENLVDSSGRRNSVSESDFARHIKGGAQLLEGSRKILQRTSVSGGGSYRIELIHDSFCAPLAALKAKREKAAHRRNLLFGISFGLLGLFIAGILFYQNRRLHENELVITMLQNQSLKGQEKTDAARQEAAAALASSADGEGFVVDGIQYLTNAPDDKVLAAWKKKYHETCRNKISGQTGGYTIPPKMLAQEPCLVYLILNSQSIGDHEEKQSWFDLYGLMNEEQVSKLYDILYRESYKLAEIENRYQTRQAEIAAQAEAAGQQSPARSITDDTVGFVIDDIQYLTNAPDEMILTAWKKKYHETCRNKISGQTGGYTIPPKMLAQEPCLVYLILNSQSIGDHKEKQSWFDLYDLMNEEQLMKLYDILYRESYKLAEVKSLIL